jgi:hypothetical protein
MSSQVKPRHERSSQEYFVLQLFGRKGLERMQEEREERYSEIVKKYYDGVDVYNGIERSDERHPLIL